MRYIFRYTWFNSFFKFLFNTIVGGFGSFDLVWPVPIAYNRTRLREKRVTWLTAITVTRPGCRARFVPGKRAWLRRHKDRGPPQRHSVEVTTGAGGYRHIRPNEVGRPKGGVLALPAEGAITEESMTSSGNSETTDNHAAQPELAGNGRTTVNFLPPALNCMVRLWDEIAADMIQVKTKIHYLAVTVRHAAFRI